MIFPNLVVLRSQIRTIRPIAVDRTEVFTKAVKLQGVSDEVNLTRLRDQEFEFGAAGTFFTDDIEIFERTQEGLQSNAVEICANTGAFVTGKSRHDAERFIRSAPRATKPSDRRKS